MNIRKISFFLLFILICGTGCYKNEPVPSADFLYAGNNEFRIPCTVIFTNQSVNSFSWEWRFGDDSTATLQDAVHTYYKPGTYSVYLRAYTESRKEWASQIKEIVIKDTLK
jgi:PKD repeat protein